MRYLQTIIFNLSRKIALNSAYGAIGNQYFRYFDVRHAEGITMAGQLTIRWIERDVNDYLNKLLRLKILPMLLRLIQIQSILN